MNVLKVNSSLLQVIGPEKMSIKLAYFSSTQFLPRRWEFEQRVEMPGEGGRCCSFELINLLNINRI